MAAISTACRTFWVVLLCVAVLEARAAERAAEVVSVQGQGESRPDDKAAWRPAAPRQELFPSNYVRTGAYSRMGLLFQDRTQVRLAEKTLMQIKASATAPGERTVLRLEQGRSWSQTNAAPANLYLETPSATAAIRGTDWDIEVFEGGRSLLTVFSGEVDFFNDFGRLTVAKNESAQAIPGQAPTRIIIANPRDRVQWVTAYAVEPLRHIDASAASPALREVLEMIRRGETAQAAARISSASMPDDPGLVQLARIALLVRSERFEEAFNATTGALAAARQPAPYLIASDLMVYEGKLDRANAFALEGLVRFRDDPRLVAQLARVSLVAGDFDVAQRRLASAMSAPKPAFEVRLAAADTARAQGEGRAARAGYEAARAERPSDDRPWHGIGVVDSEREAVASARMHLNAALERNPGGPGYQGELGTLETFADRFEDAQAAFGAGLKANPADYVALTGLGVLELKRGHPEAALENFLRASMLEPRFARAHVFAAVANYQLGRRGLALRELERASELDDKDPLPYLLASMINTDLFRAGDAIEAARRGMQRLPYLKSLNQIANDRQGGANLGRSLSFFGLEEWAQSRAQESYYPYWAGSHLFLSDRYAGEFNKNSELLQGFLTDPTVFGSSNRFQSLIARPGNYGRAIVGYAYSDDVNARIGVGRFNGMSYAGMPIAYLVDVDSTRFRFTSDALRGPSDGRAFTGALGIRPSNELGFFLYGFDTKSDDAPRSPALDLTQRLLTSAVNAGMHYRFSPQSQLWMRAGVLRNDNRTQGTLFGDGISDRLVSRVPEYGLRHTFDAGRHQLTWGFEAVHKKLHDDFVQGPGDDESFLTALQFTERSRNAFVSDTFDFGTRLRVQADAWWQENHRVLDRDDTGFFNSLGLVLHLPTVTEERSLRKVTPRVGFRLRFSDAVLLRAAYQDWIRPMGTSTLGPVATAGIPMEDRLVARGGRQKRARVQLEAEASSRTFVSAYVDHKKIENRRFSFSPFLVSEDENLSKLRDFDYGRLGALDLYEFISAPEFDAGRITLSGAAVNQVMTDVLSLSVKYQYTTSRNTGPNFPGRMIAYHPKNAGAFGLTFVSPYRIYFTTRVVYRSLRYTDEANLSPYRAGWDGACDIFWESFDKRLRLRFGVDNAFHKEKPTLYSASFVLNF